MADYRPCESGCGSLIAGRDKHPLCISCLGLAHAQEALDGASACAHCAGFPKKYLARRVKAAAVAAGVTPSTLHVGLPDDEEGETSSALDWADQTMEIVVTNTQRNPASLLSVPEGDVLEIGCEQDIDVELFDRESSEEVGTNLLPSGTCSSRPPGSQGDNTPVDQDLLDGCRRASARLEIEWPPSQGVQGV